MEQLNLTQKQIRAMHRAAENGGIIDTFAIAGATGGSLVKKGMMFRHFVPDDFGSTITYQLTSAGWRWLREYRERH